MKEVSTMQRLAQMSEIVRGKIYQRRFLAELRKDRS